MRALGEVAAQRKIRVERVVRVACPARGTLLASKRLDAYVSVLKWALELAGVPVVPALVEFLGEVARRRADPELLPGLAAQIPDSPLVRWLHAAEAPIPGDLRVVAGDIEGDSVVSWLKTLLADAFYWTDNDLVVQTRSMYGGAPRADGATFLFDQGGKVSHFNYFSNERTAGRGRRCAAARSSAGLSTSSGRCRGRASRPRVPRAPSRTVRGRASASDKPAVFVLPGILGSNLKVDGKRIWLGWRVVNGLMRLGYDAGRPTASSPTGPIGRLRRPRRFPGRDARGDRVRLRLAPADRGRGAAPRRSGRRRRSTRARRERSSRCASLAHSMGGLARAHDAARAPRRLGADDGAPGRAPADAGHAERRLVGADAGAVGRRHVRQYAGRRSARRFRTTAARQLMAAFPGFMQLQAGLTDAEALDRQATWQKLADDDLERRARSSFWHRDEVQLDAYTWGVPPQDVLDRAVALRRRLDAPARARPATHFADKTLLVVGQAQFTPDGFESATAGSSISTRATRATAA